MLSAPLQRRLRRVRIELRNFATDPRHQSARRLLAVIFGICLLYAAVVLLQDNARVLRSLRWRYRRAMRDDDTAFANYVRHYQQSQRSGGANAEEGYSAGEAVWRRRQQKVKEAFLHAWRGYSTYAFGADEVRPVSKKRRNSFGGMGATIIDSLDTLMLMDILRTNKTEYNRVRNFVAKLNFNRDKKVSVFETTIRHLGGLLSAYELSRDSLFLTKAAELADRLLPAFDSESGIPYGDINLKTGEASNQNWHRRFSILSELGSLQLEWRYLAFHTRNKTYAEKVNHVMRVLSRQSRSNGGLFPIYVQTSSGELYSNIFTLGALGDSFYEYLLKQWLLTEKQEHQYKQLYDEAVDSILKYMIAYSEPSKMAYFSELRDTTQYAKFDHLVCFAPGMLALGAYANGLRFDGTEAASQSDTSEAAANRKRNLLHLQIAEEVTRTCYLLYKKQPTGIGPEIAYFDDNENDFRVSAPDYLLRPETVESIFLLYRITRNEKYRKWGWKIFKAIDKHCRTDIAYSGLRMVHTDTPQKNDVMESFFLAETLKYLYLLFGPQELLPLDRYVFNTEAHPLGVFAADDVTTALPPDVEPKRE